MNFHARLSILALSMASLAPSALSAPSCMFQHESIRGSTLLYSLCLENRDSRISEMPFSSHAVRTIINISDSPVEIRFEDPPNKLVIQDPLFEDHTHRLKPMRTRTSTVPKVQILNPHQSRRWVYDVIDLMPFQPSGNREYSVSIFHLSDYRILKHVFEINILELLAYY